MIPKSNRKQFLFFTQIHTLLSSFIWSNKTNRLSRNLLQNKRTEGGLKLPNLELYYYASQLFYINQIINDAREEPLIEIENDQLKPYNLFTSLFIKHKIKVTNFVINSTLKSWQKIKTILAIELNIPKKTKIWNNPSIKFQNRELNWDSWRKNGIQYLSDIIENNNVLSFIELQTRFALGNKEYFRYLQLRNWIIENFVLKYDVVPGPFEEFLVQPGKKKQLIGTVYNMLLKEQSKLYSMEKLYDKWNRDLQCNNVNTKWKKCVYLTNSITRNENLRLIQYKLMTRIYYTRDKIQSYYPNSSDQCEKCGFPDSLIHSFWSCAKVMKLWNEIQDWMSSIFQKQMHFSLELCIFQNAEAFHYPVGWQILFSSLICKKLILKHWRQTQAPSLNSWKGLMRYYLTIEKTLANDNNKVKQFNDVWKHIYEA